MSDVPDFNATVTRALGRYIALFPGEGQQFWRVRQALRAARPLWSRHCFPIHVTASGFVRDRASGRFLFVLHKAANRWLQPGGHCELGESPEGAARREIREETAVEPVALRSWHRTSKIPVDIDIHPIPEDELRAEPEHWHCDFRFAFEADGSELIAQAEEVETVAWLALEDPRCELPPRIAGKLRALDGS